MNRIFEQIVNAAKETPREYFAPLVGAYKGITEGIKKEYSDIQKLEKQKQRPQRSK